MFLSGPFLSLFCLQWDMQKHTLGYTCKHKLSRSGIAWSWGHAVALLQDWLIALMAVSSPCMLGKPLPWGQEGCLWKGPLHWGLWFIITPTSGSTFPNFQSCPISLSSAFIFFFFCTELDFCIFVRKFNLNTKGSYPFLQKGNLQSPLKHLLPWMALSNVKSNYMSVIKSDF